MGVIKELIQGYKDYIIGSDEVSIVLAKKRAEICEKCDHKKKMLGYSMTRDKKLKEIEGMGCDLCKCLLSAKVRSVGSECPIKNW